MFTGLKNCKAKKVSVSFDAKLKPLLEARIVNIFLASISVFNCASKLTLDYQDISTFSAPTLLVG